MPGTQREGGRTPLLNLSYSHKSLGIRGPSPPLHWYGEGASSQNRSPELNPARFVKRRLSLQQKIKHGNKYCCVCITCQRQKSSRESLLKEGTGTLGKRKKKSREPLTGAGRRLRGPEPEDDSVCEDPPEFLEGERPRPQGSSPVNEYPTTEKYTDIDKQREEEIYDPYQKSSGSKKGKKGFGSFFEKRSSAKMSQEESPESGLIVKTAKEACAEGLVVSGGGKEGIFVKEVKSESPAAKHLSLQEGDQILSATVYFDDVSYEDALQILEHAQPYKMEFCLKRKPPGPSALESSTAERQEVAPGEEGASSVNRERAKTQRRNDARISWPKFPSFTRGRKAHFKRSHSTSEAEEQRKLEMSPTTSDTESPIKSQDAVKDKTKKQKTKLSKLKMRGIKSKSVEHQDKDSVPVSRSLENVETQQTDLDCKDFF
ncbi:hypothetical protein AAFF_G00415830 [Aldrovandia affinis]|uniref:PDZ domain-containing protein n=1 Tax=Aldrovandia affinis TaxID=143900 RepID=A0AAD7SAZ5_9TELE|nr:hypothetical protein AAFF_G00415830 [Aldrovandia affinis]